MGKGNRTVTDDRIGQKIDEWYRQYKIERMDNRSQRYYNDSGFMPCRSALTGELLRPGTGENVEAEDNDNTLDSNGWRKE